MNPAAITLTIAIISEVIATTALKATEGFTKWLPSLVVVVGYGLSFYMLSLTLKYIPVGVVYAVWSGVGIVLITLLGWAVYDQKINLGTALGMGLIIAGVAVVNLFSDTAVH
ncbi:MAG TPA: QacE family quaternary ammonium compound efflux SMR transporter [Anaerolineae bacterium]|nr:QacE family quaternary ammonium compound efflux SMR transporter [Anaerolineae bacterium]HIP73992.1 QacE family quaternary ammonium compound efflux SMR transporter [Anaerolineae bacterium]